MQAQIELSGLSKVESVREPAQPVEMYVKIPIKMSLTGTYHQINRFFKQVGELKRIVNIEDLSLEPLSLAVAPEQPNLLKANFTATTFMFTDKGRGGPNKTRHADQLGRCPLIARRSRWERSCLLAACGEPEKGRRRRRHKIAAASGGRRRARRWRRCSRASSSPRRRCCRRCASGS